MRLPILASAIVIAALAACGGGHSGSLPATGGGSGIGATPTPGPTATPNLAVTGEDAVVTAAGQTVQTYYATLPHTNPSADVASLAAYMVSSGTYSSAVVTDGGITATLKDGTSMLIFADRPDALTASAAARTSSAATAAAVRRPSLAGASTSHEIAFLVNMYDTNAFKPVRQQAYANAFTQAGFTAANGFEVDDLDITLDNIVALAGHNIDFLDISTHGSVRNTAPNRTYVMASTTPVSDAARTQYAADYTNGSLIYSSTLRATKGAAPLVTFAFTPAFLTNHLTFNAGATVDNQSCHGANTNVDIPTSYGPNVGITMGWSSSVGSDDADQTDAFYIDRLLGEYAPTGLGTYVTQRTPAQRAFSPSNVELAMANETRTGPIETRSFSYDVSQSAYNNAQFVQTNSAVAPAVLNNGLPSITTMTVNEGTANGTLTINGDFSNAKGSVQLTDTAGTVHALAPTAWSTSAVQVTIPAGGAGSSGIVQVLSAEGVPSNPAPLTSWTGTLTYTESDTIPDLSGVQGAGNGTLSVVYNVDFRADVHAVVPMIDTSPQPQSFAFGNVEGDSRASITNYAGTFANSDGTKTAAWGEVMPPPALTPALPPLSQNTFEMRTIANQPSPCSNGFGGLQGGGNTFCPITGFVAPSVPTCSSSGADLCGDGEDGIGSYGGPYDAQGLLELTMDPTTYAITVAGTRSTFTSEEFDGDDRPATASMSGTIGAPVAPPTAMTPALRR